MERTHRTVYRSTGLDKDFDVLEIKNNTVTLCNAWREYAAADLRELARIAAAAAEELDAIEAAAARTEVAVS